jgi:adenosylcobinamide-GDP ribazoletransferase
MFYTRIPCPKISIITGLFKQSIPIFSFNWLDCGCCSFSVYAAASWLWNAEIGIVLSMIASILITGAFHEDGFADVCDGFGGGWTKTKI